MPAVRGPPESFLASREDILAPPIGVSDKKWQKFWQGDRDGGSPGNWYEELPLREDRETASSFLAPREGEEGRERNRRQVVLAPNADDMTSELVFEEI